MREMTPHRAWEKIYRFVGFYESNAREDMLAIALAKVIERLENASITEFVNYTLGVDPVLPTPPKLSDSTGDPPPRPTPSSIESTGDAKS